MTSKIVGTNCLNVLKNIGAFSKEALILMNNQSIFHLNFVEIKLCRYLFISSFIIKTYF